MRAIGPPRPWPLALWLGAALLTNGCARDCKAMDAGRGFPPTTCAPGCCSGWVCGSDVYEVKCVPDGGSESCSCLENGVSTRDFSFKGWCGGDPTAYQANYQCGWQVPGADGRLPAAP